MTGARRLVSLAIASLAIGTQYDAAAVEWEWDDYQAIQLSITSPQDNELFPTGASAVLTFTGVDEDKKRCLPAGVWEEFEDSVTYTWSGAGEFDPEVSIPDPAEGPNYTADWTAPYTAGSHAIQLTANDEGSVGQDNKDSQLVAARNVKTGHLDELSGNYPNKPGGAIAAEDGDPDPKLYIPQSATATFTASATAEGFADGWPRWTWVLNGGGWERDLDNGDPTGTLKPTAPSTDGQIKAFYGLKPNRVYYQVDFDVYCVKLVELTASEGDSSVTSQATDRLKIARNRSATLTATFFPDDAPDYSKSSLTWKVTDKPQGANPTVGGDPTAFASATDGDYTVAGWLDVSGDDTVDAAESSGELLINVSQALIRFADAVIDVFDKESTYSRTFTVEIDDPSQADENVDVTLTRTDGTSQFTKLTGANDSTQTKQVTLDSDGKGSTTFQITENDGAPGPGVDSLEAVTGNLSDTRDARACGITSTTVTYQAGGVNHVGIDFNVKIEPAGIGLEHYQKRQYWAANPQSVFTAGKFEYPTGTVIQAPWNTTRQNEVDWTSWANASSHSIDIQTSINGQVLNGAWRYAYAHVDRYFTIKYRNVTNGNTIVEDFNYDWDFAWNNHNLKKGDWWTEAGPGDNGTVSRVNNIVNFPWGP